MTRIGPCVDNGLAPRGCVGDAVAGSGGIGFFVEDDKSHFGTWFSARSANIPDATGLCQTLTFTDFASALVIDADGHAIRQDTAASGAGNFTTLEGNNNWLFSLQYDFIVKIALESLTDIRFAFGFSNTNGALLDNPGNDHAMIQFSPNTRSDVNWQGVNRLGATQTVTDLGVAPTIAATYLRISIIPGVSITYFVYDRLFVLQSETTVTVNIPSSAGTKYQCQQSTLIAGTKSMRQFFGKIKATPV